MDHKELIDDYNSGKTNAELAEIYGSTPKAISMRLSRLRKLGWVGTKKEVWTDEEDMRLVELKDQHMTNKEIAELMGRSYTSVKTRAYALNLLMPGNDECCAE